MDAVVATGTSKNVAWKSVAARTRLPIGALSKAAGTTPETIRYYERIGLMPPPPRTQGGRRVYTLEDAGRLSFIRRARHLGFSLAEIGGLLALVESGGDVCARVRRRTLEHSGDIRRKIVTLERAARELEETAALCSQAGANCAIVDRLFSMEN